MSADDDRELRVHALDLAGEVGDDWDVGGVAAFQPDQVRLKRVDLLLKIDAGHTEVGKLALRDVRHGGSEILRAERLDPNCVVETRRVPALGLHEQNAPDV